jgi:[acyl-carrier-protein] S-malonyltransferase
MLNTLAESYSVIQETFAIASQVVGFDCWDLAQSGPQAALDQTVNTQPILLAADIALWRIYCTEFPSIKPAFLAGHSLGEYAALVAAESISFEDAIHIVAQRGQFMQSAAPQGEGASLMAAILGLDNLLIEQICKQVTELNRDTQQIVAPANYNAIGQTVIAGHTSAVMQAIEAMKQAGAKRAIPLPVSVPSHCALMQPAVEKLAAVLEKIEIRTPKIPILHNKDVQLHTQPNEIRSVLCEQLVHPVRWVQTIQQFCENRVQNIIECGPGKVLSGLIKRIDNTLHVYNMDTPTSLSEILCLKTMP